MSSNERFCGLYVEYVYTGTFWIYIPYSTAHRPSYPVPPPTTLVGALAAGLARYVHSSGLDVRGEVSYEEHPYPPWYRILAECMKSVHYAQLDGYATIVEDITRFFQGTYVRSSNVEDPNQRWGVKISAKMYATGCRAAVLYVVDEKKLGEHGIDLELLRKGAYSITRVGPCESVVVVERVEIARDLEIASLSDVENDFVEQGTYFYTEIPSTTIEVSPWITIDLPNHARFREWFQGEVHRALSTFLVPVDEAMLRMRIVAPFRWSTEIVEKIVENLDKAIGIRSRKALVFSLNGRKIVVPEPCW